MRMELIILVGQNVSVWNEVVLTDSELLLGLHKVETESVLPCNLVAHREVVNSLKLVQTFIKERFAGAGRPKDIPLVRVSISETVCFKDTSD